MAEASGPYARAKKWAAEGLTFEQIRAGLMQQGLSDGEASMLARTVTEKVEEPVKPPPRELKEVPADMVALPSAPPSQFNLDVILGIIIFIAGILMLVTTRSPIAGAPVFLGLFFLVKGFRTYKEIRSETLVVRTPDCVVHKGTEGLGKCPSCSAPLCSPCTTRALERKYCPLCEK